MTSKIRLYASVAVLTIPPPIIARMAVTIDEISGGRFGVNIVSGYNKKQYDQMGVWPGDEFFQTRYDYSAEYVQILKELWTDGESNFKGEYLRDEQLQARAAARRTRSRSSAPAPPAAAWTSPRSTATTAS